MSRSDGTQLRQVERMPRDRNPMAVRTIAKDLTVSVGDAKLAYDVVKELRA